MKGLPRSGGEKNYLEFIYRKPKFMATCTFMAYSLIMVFLFGQTFSVIYLTYSGHGHSEQRCI